MHTLSPRLWFTLWIDVVWPTNKQIKLIDSIYRNFYIPPVVFAVQKDDDEVDVRVCVDGKQVRNHARRRNHF